MTTNAMITATLQLLANSPSEGGALGTLAKFFRDGGPFMYVNIFWLACALAVIVERVWRLMFTYNLTAAPFMEQVTKLVMSGNIDRAVKLCGAAPNSPLARVLKAGLARAPKGEIEVAKSLEEAVLENTPRLSSRIQWLWSIANIATLVGLIGTIVGLIGTFQALGNLPADQKQAKLSEGISEAMNNTAFGLTIAVTCIIAHMILSSYAKQQIETIELSAMRVENLLGRRGEAGEAGASA